MGGPSPSPGDPAQTAILGVCTAELGDERTCTTSRGAYGGLQLEGSAEGPAEMKTVVSIHAQRVHHTPNALLQTGRTVNDGLKLNDKGYGTNAFL